MCARAPAMAASTSVGYNKLILSSFRIRNKLNKLDGVLTKVSEECFIDECTV